MICARRSLLARSNLRGAPQQAVQLRGLPLGHGLQTAPLHPVSPRRCDLRLGRMAGLRGTLRPKGERCLHANRAPMGVSGGHARSWRTARVPKSPNSPCSGGCTRCRRGSPTSGALSTGQSPRFPLEPCARHAERFQAARGSGGRGRAWFRGGRHETQEPQQAAGCQPAGKTEGRAPSQCSTKSRYMYTMQSLRKSRRSADLIFLHPSKKSRTQTRSIQPVFVAMCTRVPSLHEGPAIRAEEIERRAAFRDAPCQDAEFGCCVPQKPEHPRDFVKVLLKRPSQLLICVPPARQVSAAVIHVTVPHVNPDLRAFIRLHGCRFFF